MAKNKKPKFLEAETPELLALLKETLESDLDPEKIIDKATKIANELVSRLPDEDIKLSVEEALHLAADSMTEALNKVKDAYEAEISLIEDTEADEDTETEADEDEEEEEEAPKAKKSKKSKKSAKEEKPTKSKKSKKVEPEEDEEDEDEDEDDGEDTDYSDWATKDLKKECRNRGIKVTKGMAKSDLVKALEADDKE